MALGQFANTLFRVLLGWVQTAASWLWNLIADTDANAWLRWLLDHWLPLLVWLCIGGLAIDLIVYLLRWQPYRVWGSFLRRMTEKEKVAPEPEAPRFQRKWAYADGTMQVEEIREIQQENGSEPPLQLDQPIRPPRRMARRASPEQSYHQPVYPPQWQHEKKQGENR